MRIGFTIHKGDGSDIFSPPFPRGGQDVNASIEVLRVDGLTLTVTLQHKNLEDTTWATLVGFAAMTTTGVKSANATGCKEMLRYKYAPSGSNAYDSIDINCLAPQWRP